MECKKSDLQKVIDYLKQKADLFKEVREKFHIGDDLGLVSVPEYHEYNIGQVSKILLKDGKDYTKYQGVFGGTILLEIKPERIVVRPVYKNDEAYVVSIYFSPGVVENIRGFTLDEKFLLAPDEIIKGLFAHECAEYLLNFKKESIPSEMLAILEEKMQREEFTDQNWAAILSGLQEQCSADSLACLFGYKEEIIAYLEFNKKRIQEQEDFPGGLYRPPRRKVEELQTRIDFIKKVIE